MGAAFFIAGVFVAKVFVEERVTEGTEYIGDQDFTGGTSQFVSAGLTAHAFDEVAQAQEADEFADMGGG